MRVLIACECSGIVRDAFIAMGFDAWSCDIKPTERPGPHYQCDVLKILRKRWAAIIAHPDCTFLTNSGCRHLYAIPSVNGVLAKIHGVERWVALHHAARFFNTIKNTDCPLIAIENPIPHGYAKDMIGDYTQLIQPWQFGHGETKATCLWLKGLPKLAPTNIVKGREQRVHKMSPSEKRKTERSRTYQGIANAMADQWGPVIRRQCEATANLSI